MSSIGGGLSWWVAHFWPIMAVVVIVLLLFAV